MKMRKGVRFFGVLWLSVIVCSPIAVAGLPADSIARVSDAMRCEGLRSLHAYVLLDRLLRESGARLSGSAGAAKAVALTQTMMQEEGFSSVHAESVMVPRWIRGRVERCTMVLPSGTSRSLSIAALGGSIGTPKRGVAAGVIEVHSFDELARRAEEARGKIVFFNRPMDPTLVNTFAAYGGAVDQRAHGAVAASRFGAVAVLVRSMTLLHDDAPHTGMMSYADSVTKIPAGALSIVAAEALSQQLQLHPDLRVKLALDCATMPDVPSANVVGEIKGWEHPEEVIVVGGHLDSWDKGIGAHDDGAGCMQAIEVLRLFQKAGITPRRTIRAVMFMNEENGVRGGLGYVADHRRASERHIALIESDRGGFVPLGFSVQADSAVVERVRRWSAVLASVGAGAIEQGHAGTDVSPMVETGVPGFGLVPESQRYFDVHHSANDTIDKVNPRELELGAIAEAILCYLLSEEGLN
jgi:carboxypeptidase Q